MPPPSTASGRIQPRFTIASVAVASVPPRSYAAGPGTAPALRAQLLFEPLHVARHLRPDVGVQAHGREALVLAVLREHLGGDREERLREVLAHDLRHAPLVLGVQEREEEADRDRLDALL